MLPTVHLQLVVDREAHVAEIALEWLLARVSPHMDVKLVGGQRLQAAQRAEILFSWIFLGHMHVPNVFIQAGLNDKGTPAMGALVAEAPLSPQRWPLFRNGGLLGMLGGKVLGQVLLPHELVAAAHAGKLLFGVHTLRAKMLMQHVLRVDKSNQIKHLFRNAIYMKITLSTVLKMQCSQLCGSLSKLWREY